MDFRSFFEYIGAGVGKRDAISGMVSSTKEQAQRTLKALELLEALRASWNQVDPGKGMPYVFFVRDCRVNRSLSGAWIEWCDAFFAREFVTDPKRAEEGVRGIHRDDRPTTVPLGDFKEARRESCNVCGKRDAYVIGRYRQSCDSPHGDTWELELLTLCTDCLNVLRIGHRVEGQRFGHLLKRPGT